MGVESILMILSGARNWRTGGDSYRVRDSFLQENVPNLAVEMAALLWEYSKNHRVVHFKWVNLWDVTHLKAFYKKKKINHTTPLSSSPPPHVHAWISARHY